MRQPQLRRYDGPRGFADAAFDFLEEHEAAHNIFFGVTDDAIEYPRRFQGDNLFATVEDRGEIQLALMQTPPHMLVLSRAKSPDYVAWLADEMARGEREIPGLLSSPDEAGVFIDRFAASTGQVMSVASRQRIYEATRVDIPESVEGAFRHAEHEDLDRLTDWVVAFEQGIEVQRGDTRRDEVARKVSEFIRAGAAAVWEVDGELVSMAAARGPTPHGIRISHVYTPPDRRRNGYASACTAHLTQSQFDSGREFCFLFTDLDNPTSNHIYQEIGYVPVSDMNVYAVPE